MKSPIRKRREALGLSRAELAVVLNISYTHTSSLERCEQQPSPELLRALARLFNVEPKTLEHELTAYRDKLRHEVQERVTNVGSTRR